MSRSQRRSYRYTYRRLRNYGRRYRMLKRSYNRRYATCKYVKKCRTHNKKMYKWTKVRTLRHRWYKTRKGWKNYKYYAKRWVRRYIGTKKVRHCYRRRVCK